MKKAYNLISNKEKLSRKNLKNYKCQNYKYQVCLVAVKTIIIIKIKKNEA